MAIQILPARLANQIAAGEVVERPASVIKELVENSLDAGATKIHLDIEKGGAKRIRISDNGAGIAKDELGLALSRHATSKIKDLSDLEAISSLGFRGEALASISSVSRLTLTSKPAEQDNAWQATTQGRDMEVTVQPAAHPNGTTIEVNDLFFNTPARRKFMRTEKTEFNHIDEMIRRIALAKFHVTFTLVHNGKTIRQYRAADTQAQKLKRVAAVCGQKFVDNSIEIECLHDNLHLWGWVAKPSYTRTTNDLCYSYVNGRMMRDKLINHGIRQAFADRISNDGYPAFVLFLELDHKEVDVNVHPAKHEVRFHQGRYVHDFIFSVCHQALEQSMQENISLEAGTDCLAEQSSNDELGAVAQDMKAAIDTVYGSVNYQHAQLTEQHRFNQSISDQLSPAYTGASRGSQRDYIKPLNFSSSSQSSHSIANQHQASKNYQTLMTPYQASEAHQLNSATEKNTTKNEQTHLMINPIKGITVLDIINSKCALMKVEQSLRLVSLDKFARKVEQKSMIERWQQGIISQPLLLPVVITLDSIQKEIIEQAFPLFEKAGISINIQSREKIQIRQFPAMLREKDVNACFEQIVNFLVQHKENVVESTMINALVSVKVAQSYDLVLAQQLVSNAANSLSTQLNDLLYLNSVEVDLTSELNQLG